MAAKYDQQYNKLYDYITGIIKMTRLYSLFTRWILSSVKGDEPHE